MKSAMRAMRSTLGRPAVEADAVAGAAEAVAGAALAVAGAALAVAGAALAVAGADVAGAGVTGAAVAGAAVTGAGDGVAGVDEHAEAINMTALATDKSRARIQKPPPMRSQPRGARRWNGEGALRPCQRFFSMARVRARGPDPRRPSDEVEQHA
jgi:hypothetical protein